MKKLLTALFTIGLLAMPFVASATPVSWDFSGGNLLQPLQSAWGAQIKGSYFTATSSTQASTFPYASTTAISSSNLSSGNCVQASTGGLLTTTGSPCSSGGGGSGTVGTSSSETATRVPFWTTTSATPALLSGGSSNFTWDNSNSILSVLHLLNVGSSTLQNFTAINSTTTSATSTSFFATTASSTNLFGQLINGFGLSTCSGTNALTWSGGSFGCAAVPQGTVTAVTATWPIISSGGTIPNITWAGLATSSNIAAPQVLYATGVNTIASVATGTVSAGSTAITATSNRYVLGGALSIDCATASISQTGCLSSTDWTTFNNKQPAGNYITALTGDVTASGPGSAAVTLATVNSNVGSFTNANITVNGKGLITAASNGVASFGKAFEIDASGWLAPTTSIGVSLKSSGTTYGLGWNDALLGYASTTNGSTIFGLGAGNDATTTDLNFSGHIFMGNSAFGYQALNAVASSTGANFGYQDSAFGYQSLLSNTTGSFNTAFGASSLSLTTSTNANTAIGYMAGSSIKNGNRNTAVGEGAIGLGSISSVAEGSDNTAVGSEAIYTPGSSGIPVNRNTVVGSVGSQGGLTTSNRTGGDDNTLIGFASGRSLTTGYGNTFLGSSNTNGNITTGGGNIGIGYNIFFPTASTNNTLNIGNILFGTVPATSTAWAVPTAGTIGIGTSSPYAKLSIASQGSDTTANLFTISSSTAAFATTTLFNISNNGTISTNYGSGCLQSSSGVFSVTGSSCGTVTSLSVVTNQGVSGSFSAGATPALTLTLGALTGVTSLNGLIVTANTGVITTGTWNGTSIATQYGGLGANFSASTGALSINSGTVSAGTLSEANGGTATSTWSSDGGIVFASTTSKLSQSLPANLYWDEVNKRLGIGSSTPTVAFSVGLGTATSSALVAEYAFGRTGNVGTSTAYTFGGASLPSNHIVWPIGTSATTFTLCMTPGQTFTLRVVNPSAGTTGTITWALCSGDQLNWPGGTAPTQTLTVNKYDVWSFVASGDYSPATSTTAVSISGAQTAAF